ncbi:MAG: SPFH domain-containing protein [Myxococcota bacterium]
METTLAVIGVSIVVALLLLVAIGFTLKRIFIVPKSNEAIIRTGGRGPTVSKGGGIVVLPVIHDFQRMSLEAVSVSINRTNQDALRTQDKFLAEVEGTMLVRVDAQDNAHILLAAQSLGDGTAAGVERVVYEKTGPIVTDAMRNATMQKTFLELNEKKAEFGAQVLEAVADDLQKLGLQLVSVTITEVRQQPFDPNDNSVFTAEGRRNAAEIVERNREETNRITRQAQIKIQQQDVEAREKALALQFRQEQKEADNARQVEEYKAMQVAETRQNVLKQEQATAEAEASQMRAVKEAQIEEARKVEQAEIAKARALAVAAAAADAEKARARATQKVAEEEAARQTEEAEIARQRSVEAAQIEKQKTIKVAEEARQQAIEEAEVVRQVAVAEKRAEEAQARASQAAAEARQREAEEEIVTVRARAEAVRRKEVTVIKAEEEAQQDRIEADKAAYVETRRAEAERDAAQKRAEAVKATAVGQAAAKKAAAEGDAEAIRIAAEAYATEKTTRAQADFAASENEARALVALAEAELEQGRARAEARRLLVEAENAVANELLIRDVTVQALQVAPAVVREFMAPVSNVAHDVKVLQVNGLGGDNGDAASIPATILGTGMALSGALPVVNAMVKGLAESDDVKELAGALADVAKASLNGAEKDGDTSTAS